jgi:hypothetical protein
MITGFEHDSTCRLVSPGARYAGMREYLTKRASVLVECPHEVLVLPQCEINDKSAHHLLITLNAIVECLLDMGLSKTGVCAAGTILERTAVASTAAPSIRLARLGGPKPELGPGKNVVACG